MTNTWQDPDLREQCSMAPQEALAKLQNILPVFLRKKYKWGINQRSQLPYLGLSFFSIYICVADEGHGPRNRFNGHAAMDRNPRTLVHAQYLATVIRSHFANAPEDVRLVNVNDVLVSFFNSVPQTHPIDSVYQSAMEWKYNQMHHVLSADTTTPGNPSQLSYFGKYRKTSRSTRYTAPDDLAPIVQASMSPRYFLALNQVWKQSVEQALAPK